MTEAAGEPIDAETRFNRMYAGNFEIVMRYMTVGAGPDAAEDLCADTFCQAWDALPRFRGEEDMAGRWLLRIARHRLIDHHRHRRRLRFLRLLDTTPAPSADSDVHLILADAVASAGDLGSGFSRVARAAGIGYHELAALTGRSEVSLRQAHSGRFNACGRTSEASDERSRD